MFCDTEQELLLYQTILEKRPHLNDFERHYLNLAVWVYINHPEKFKEITQMEDRPVDEFDYYRQLIELEEIETNKK